MQSQEPGKLLWKIGFSGLRPFEMTYAEVDVHSHSAQESRVGHYA